MILLFLMVIFFVMYFNRVPYLDNIAINNQQLIKPCAGELVAIEDNSNYLHLYWFLGVTDIHSQIMPVNGTIINVKNDGDELYPANQFDRAKENKRIVTTILTKHHAKIIIEQVSGILTAKITNHLKRKQSVNAGDKIGRIYLGSQVVLRLPKSHYSRDKIIEKIGQENKIGSLLYA